MVEELVQFELQQRLLKTAKLLASTDLAPAQQGNFSARDCHSGHVAITPHAYPYEDMTIDDLAILDAEGQRVGGRLEPSCDWRIHSTVYARRPEVHAVIHTEPPYVNAFGAVGLSIPAVTTTGLKYARDAVPVMPFRSVRDDQFISEMLGVMGDAHAVIWRNHGLLVIADSIEQAADKSVAIEYNAKVAYRAMQLGNPQLVRYNERGEMVVD